MTSRRFVLSLAFAFVLAQFRPAQAQEARHEPSRFGAEANAYALAIGGTALPMAVGALLINKDYGPLGAVLFFSGAVIGPSAGEFYAHSQYSWIGIGARLAGSAVFLSGAAESIKHLFCGGNPDREGSCPDHPGEPAMAIGLLVYGAGAVFSLVDTHVATGRLFEPKTEAKTGLTPTFNLSTGGQPQVGTTIWRHF